MAKKTESSSTIKGQLMFRKIKNSRFGLLDRFQSHLSFRPTVRLPVYDLDFRDVLRDVFSAYLLSKNQVPYDYAQELPEEEEIIEKEIAEDDPRVIRSSHEAPEDKLEAFFKEQTPSYIKSELTERFNKLKATSDSVKTHPPSKKKCVHLMKGFSEDHMVATEQVICPQEKSRSLIDDENLTLIIEPPEILFDTYAVGQTYKKKCWLRNRTGSLMKGRVIQPRSTEWSIDRSGNLTLSTGLSIQITVSFTPIDLIPKSSSFSVIMSRGPSFKKKEFTVPIIACRQTPSLEGFIRGSDSNGIFNYLDGGKAFLNSTIITKVVLTNKGSLSTFILSEDTSSTSELEDEEECEKVNLFILNPCEFTLEREESVEVEISFRPLTEGNFVKNMKLLCTDDVCTDKFCIVGEGVTLSRENILFNGLEKKFPIKIEDDMMAENYIDLGKVFSNGYRKKDFNVLNTSVLPLKYHWEYRLAEVNSDYFNIPECSLKLNLHSGIMQPNEEETFELTCHMSGAVPGIYKAVISLIIDEVTEECLRNVDEWFIIKPNKSSIANDTNIISLNCGEVEIWLEVVLPRIVISPSIIEMSLSDIDQSDTMELQVKNISHESVVVEWKRNSAIIYPNFYIMIDPDEPVAIKEKGIFNFRVKARASRISCFGINYIEETFVCLVNEFETCTVLKVKVDLIKDEPETDGNTGNECEEDSSISFSYSLVGSPPRDLIHLEPTCRNELITIFEEKIKTIVSKFNCSRKSLKFNDSNVKQVFDYAMSCIGTEGLVLGVLEWDEELNWVVGDLRGHDVVLLPTTLHLYLFHQFHDKSSIIIQNRSLIETNFRWGEKYGKDAGKLKIWLKKSEGVLKPNSKTEVDIFIFPFQYGEINDLKIPCYIEHLSEPLTLHVQGVVEPLRILIQWDIERGFYQTSWDPTANDSILSLAMKTSILDEELVGFSNDFKQALGTTSLLKIVNELKEGIVCTDRCGPRIKGEMDIPEISINTVMGDYGPVHTGLDATRDSYMLLSDTCGPLGCRMGNVVTKVLDDKALHFNINLGQGTTQYVTLKNLTPIKTSFFIKAEIFSSTTEAPEYPLYFIEEDSYALDILSYSITSKQKEAKRRKYGLNLVVDPSSRELDSYQDIEIGVTAIADVWGDYVDVLVLSVSGLPTYSIPVCVTATGSPISFTFDPRPHPHFRFGTLTPNEEASYEVILRNNSYVPLKVGWNLYCKPLQQDDILENSEKLPFGLMADLHDTITDSFCKVALTEYFGEQMNNPYEVLAKNIMEKGELVIQRRYVMKNLSRAETQVFIETEDPFSLFDVQAKDNKQLKFIEQKHKFILHPLQTVAVFITFTITRESLATDEELFNGEIEEVIQTSKQSSLYIHQPLLNKTQEVVLKYDTVYPYLNFSSKRLVFGPVFVNEVKVKVLRITAVSGREDIKIEHGDYYDSGESPFSFSHSSAHLEQGGSIDISISFSPGESTGYLDELKVKTSVPSCIFCAVLEGVGTWNYKFHQLLKH